MQASLPNGLMPAHSRDICLGHPNLILAQPSQVFPLLELLVSREDLPPLSFWCPYCPRTHSLTGEVAIYPGKRAHLHPISSPPPTQSPPKHQELVWLGAWTTRPLILSPLLDAGPGLPASSPHLHTLDGPFFPQFPPAPEKVSGNWQRGWQMGHKLTQMAELA